MGRTVGRSQSNSGSPMKRTGRQPRISYAEDPSDDLSGRRTRGRPKKTEPPGRRTRKRVQKEDKKKVVNNDVEMSADEEASNDSVEMESESSPDPAESDPAKESLIEEIKTEYKRVKKNYDDRVMKDGYVRTWHIDFSFPIYQPPLLSGFLRPRIQTSTP